MQRGLWTGTAAAQRSRCWTWIYKRAAEYDQFNEMEWQKVVRSYIERTLAIQGVF
jgi:hypothetical protein